jgi:hypothetical protein
MKDILLSNDKQTPRELLPVFYKQYNLEDDGGQNSPSVKIEFTKKISLYFPNFKARRKAVFKHDVHHIATGYASTFKGETEIGAWEIASGCRHYWVAFVLDLHAVMIGLLFNPVGVYKAFIKGRRTKNLYEDIFTDMQLMDMSFSEIKENMLLSKYPEKQKGNLSDFILFMLLLLFGAVYSVLSLLLFPFILVYTIYVILKLKPRTETGMVKG